MSLLSTQTIAVLVAGAALRAATRRTPLAETLLAGLRFAKALPRAELPALLAPPPPGHVVTAAARREAAAEALAQPRFQGSFAPVRAALLGLDGTALAGFAKAARRDAEEWALIHEDFGGRELSTLALLALYAALGYALVAGIECARGLPPSATAAPVLLALGACACWALRERLLAVGRRGSLWAQRSEAERARLARLQGAEARYALGAAAALAALAFAAEAALLFWLPGGHGPSGGAAVPGAAARAAAEGLPLLDLGAGLRLGLAAPLRHGAAALALLLRRAASAEEAAAVAAAADPSDAALAAAAALVAAAVGALGALLFAPLRLAGRLAHALTSRQRLAAIASAPRRLAFRAWAAVHFYAPLAAAALWLRPLAELLVPRLLVRCGAADASRDCWPAGGLGGKRSGAADGGEPGALLALPVLTETQFLQLRAALVAGVALLQAGALRALLQASLDAGAHDQVERLVRAAEEAPANVAAAEAAERARVDRALGRPGAGGSTGGSAAAGAEAEADADAVRPSGYTPSQLDALAEELQKDHLRAKLGAASTGVLLLAAPALLGALALLLIRLGALEDGLGVCAAYGAGMQAAGLGGLVAPRGSRAPQSLVIDRVVSALDGRGGAGDLPLAAVGVELQAAFGAAFWRPVLSFALFFLLAAGVVMQETGWLLASIAPPRGGEAAEAEPAGEAAAPAAPAVAAAAADAKKQR